MNNNNDQVVYTVTMDKKYCGVGKTPKGKVIGDQAECAKKGQIRKYGLIKIDSKIISDDIELKKEEKRKRDIISKQKRDEKKQATKPATKPTPKPKPPPTPTPTPKEEPNAKAKPITTSIKIDHDTLRKTSNYSIKERLMEQVKEVLKQPKAEPKLKIEKEYDFGIDTNKFKIYSETNTQREIRKYKEGTKEYARLKKKLDTKAEQKRQQTRKDFIKLFTHYTKLRDENENNKNDKEIMKIIHGSGLINLSSYMDIIEREDGLE